MTTACKPRYNFQKIQAHFSAYLRDPENTPPPPRIQARRLKIYNDLFFNNMSNFLSNGFPVLRKLYHDNDWNALVRNFMRVHRCATPYFAQIGQEFVAYLQHTHASTPADPPFLIELAHYEWIETALQCAEEDIHGISVNRDGHLLQERPVLSPLVVSLVYQYPVHQISPSCRPEHPSATPHYLLVYRDRADTVQFMEINDVTAGLISRLQENTHFTGARVLQDLAHQMNQDDVCQHGANMLSLLREKDILLGTAP